MTAKMKQSDIPLPYPDSTPNSFTGAKIFVQSDLGKATWDEVCNKCTFGEYYDVRLIAMSLESLKGYANPQKYLRAIFKALVAASIEKEGEYIREDCPVKTYGRNMMMFRL